MEFEREEDYPELLIHLKSTVENLFECHPSNIWDICGGIQRLQVAITKILKHGFRFFKDNGEPDFWVFIQGLSWLQPSLAASPSFLGHPSSPIRSPLRNNDKALTWLYKSIENHTLSEKLAWLMSDQEHVLSCYRETSFLRQVQYCEATLICLRAVEQRQMSLLAKIDPALYLKRKSSRKFRRCFSTPVEVNQTSPSKKSILKSIPVTQIPQQVDQFCNTKVSDFRKLIIDSIFMSNEHEKSTKDLIKKRLLKKSFSCSDIYLLYCKENLRVNNFRRRSYSNSSRLLINNTAPDNDWYFKEILKIRYNKPGINTKTRRTSVRNQRKDSVDSLSMSSIDTVVYHNKSTRQRRKRHSSLSFFKLPFRINLWEKSGDDRSICSDDSKTLVPTADTITETNKKKSFIENGGSIALPMSMGSFPKPSPGQSIMSFLSSGVFTQTNAELDRENAHFNISEALIATLEQVKCNQQFKMMDDTLEESDEEINHLKRIIRLKRLQKQNEARTNINNESVSTDTTMTTDCSPYSLTSSAYSTCESISTDVDDENSFNDRNLSTNAKSGLSVSNLSLSIKTADDLECRSATSVSAENVAISLLRRFKENQLPSASEIEWLVSERQAPQRLLPLPNNIVVSDDEKMTLLRGTSDWAPPRPQIIFTPHPPPVRRQLMEKQSYRCAGCGTTVAQKYASKFRYCEYLGRYFCTACHSNQTAIIPGRVLTKWDFSRYAVSSFSYKLLDQMSEDPLFNVIDLNSSLYHRVKGLQKIRLLRISLFYLKDFIFTCRYANGLPDLIRSESHHIYTDPNNYSMTDFARVKNNTLNKSLTGIVKQCENHVNCCPLCQAQGFTCEICKKQEVIFPWQLRSVLRCDNCGSCHHIKCYKQRPICPKCIRIASRNELHSVGVAHSVTS